MTDTPPWAGIAVDIGGSKTDFAAVTRDGTQISWLRSGTHAPHAVGWEACAAMILGSVDQLLGSPDRKVEAIYIAASGVDFPTEEARMRQVIEATGRFGYVMVKNDTYALLASGGGLGHGVCVVAGTGMNCIGVLGDQEVRFAALGEISGDWGGGVSLSLAALYAACRAQDGRGPETRLRATVPAHFGVAEPLDVTMLLHRDSLHSRDLLPLTELVFAAAEAGDAVALAIIERLAFEVAAFIVATHRRLSADLGELPIILGGSILQHGGPLLHQAIRRQLRAPALPFVIPTHPPIVGSLGGVLQMLGSEVNITDLATRLDTAPVRLLQ